MIFKNIISISSVHIVKSELIKFDLKKYFQNSNFEISDKSGIDILIINESIAAMYQNQLLNLK